MPLITAKPLHLVSQSKQTGATKALLPYVPVSALSISLECWSQCCSCALIGRAGCVIHSRLLELLVSLVADSVGGGWASAGESTELRLVRTGGNSTDIAYALGAGCMQFGGPEILMQGKIWHCVNSIFDGLCYTELSSCVFRKIGALVNSCAFIYAGINSIFTLCKSVVLMLRWQKMDENWFCRHERVSGFAGIRIKCNT